MRYALAGRHETNETFRTLGAGGLLEAGARRSMGRC